MTLRLRLLDSIVEIHTDDAEAWSLLALLWSEMTTRDEGEPARRYTLERDGKGGWIARAADTVEAIGDTLWGVTDALRYRMLELCEERLEGFVSLHAAAVARDGAAVVLAGESGAGKTTLTLGLLDAGWTYLSDDLAPVAVDTGLVHPFPKPLGVKDPAVWERVRDAFETIPLGPPSASFLVPPSRWTVATEPLPARAVLFPKYTPGAPVEVEHLTAAKATALASAYLRRLEPPTVALLNHLCAGATCARVGYGSTTEAVSAIRDALNHRE